MAHRSFFLGGSGSDAEVVRPTALDYRETLRFLEFDNNRRYRFSNFFPMMSHVNFFRTRLLAEAGSSFLNSSSLKRLMMASVSASTFSSGDGNSHISLIDYTLSSHLHQCLLWVAHDS